MKYSALDVLLSFDRLAVGNIELETLARSNTKRRPVDLSIEAGNL